MPAVLQPTKKTMYAGQLSLLDMKTACVGPYFLNLTLPAPTQKRLAKWLTMMNAASQTPFPLEETDQVLLRARVKKGPPQSVRWQAWIALRKLSVRISEQDYLALPVTATDASLDKDLSRTFPSEPYFQVGNGQEVLKRVLGKLAGKHVEVGYCQGLNFVAGFMLLVSGGNEVETFYLLEDFLYSMQLSGLYSPDFTYLKQCMFVLAQLLHTRLPRVSSALEEHGVGPDCWMARWFLSLFVPVLPLSVVIRIWDYVLVDGPLALFKTAVALLSQAREELLSLEGLAEFFSGLAERNLSAEKLIRRMDRLKFTDAHLKTLERLWKQNHSENLEKPIKEKQSGSLSRRRTLSSNACDTTLTPPAVESPTVRQVTIPLLIIPDHLLARDIIEDWLQDADQSPLGI